MKIKNGIIHNPSNKSFEQKTLLDFLISVCNIYVDTILCYAIHSLSIKVFVSFSSDGGTCLCGFSPVQVGLLALVTLQ